MTNLRQIVRGLAARRGVDAVLLVSGDGLPIDHASSAEELDIDAVAALGATLVRNMERLGEAAGRGGTATAVLEYERGLAVLARLGGGDWLVALTAAETDVGELLFDLRRHRVAIAALL